jgi:hypothetical protein
MQRVVWAAAVASAVAIVHPAAADVTGSYDGSLSNSKKLAQTIAVGAAVSQAGNAVSGTVALPVTLATFGGAYLVQGKATPKKLKLSGTGPGGAHFKWTGKINGNTIQGKANLKAPGSKPLAAILVMTRNVSANDGSGCDGVLNANMTFFVDQVLGQALTACTSCHAPGLQAQATRLHVLRADPLTTARDIAQLVDSANPSASRILEKPLNILPHGGGPQLVAGSSQEMILEQWVQLVAAANCN